MPASTSDRFSLPVSGTPRVHYVDTLRVLAMGVVFLFHNARFFDTDYWHVKNALTYVGFNVFVGFVHQWIMPLFFVLAGAGTWFGFKKGKAGSFVSARFFRLMVPYVFGSIFLIPPQKYLERVHHESFSGTVGEFLSRYIDPGQIGFRFGVFGYLGYHLWFLGFLFVFSVLAIPAFTYLKSEAGRKFTGSLVKASRGPVGLLAWALPILLVQAGLRPLFPAYLDWADVCYWFLLFVCGYLFLSDDTFGQVAERSKWAFLTIALAAFGLMLSLYASGWLVPVERNPSFMAEYLSLQILRTVNTWSWILFMLGAGRAYLNWTTKVLDRANEAVLPFYVLHQTVILIVGFFVVQWGIGVAGKFAVTTTVSFLMIVLIFETFVRRFDLFRFLFGMKSLRPQQVENRVNV